MSVIVVQATAGYSDRIYISTTKYKDNRAYKE